MAECIWLSSINIGVLMWVRTFLIYVILYLYYWFLCRITCLCCCKRKCFVVPLHVLKLMRRILVKLNCPVRDDYSFLNWFDLTWLKGIHLILFHISLVFQEEYNAYSTLKKLFGPEIKDHMIVVFSGADSYGATIGALLCSFCVITSILTIFHLRENILNIRDGNKMERRLLSYGSLAT